jgi:hypothetical protein
MTSRLAGPGEAITSATTTTMERHSLRYTTLQDIMNVLAYKEWHPIQDGMGNGNNFEALRSWDD